MNELLSEPADSARVRAEGEYERIAFPFQNRIVIFGTGYLGNLALTGLRDAGIEPLAFCDNNQSLWGTQRDDLAVLSVAEAVTKFKDSAAFVVAIYNSSKPRIQLQTLGCTRIVPYPAVFWKFWRTMPGESRLAMPDQLLACRSEISAAFDLLSDNRSRNEFYAQVRWRCLLDYNCLSKPEDPAAMYFDKSLFSLLPEEVFVDCGAFDGDSVRAFLNVSGGEFGKIYAWEADGANCRALAGYRSQLDSEIAQRFEILPYAVGARDEAVSFCAGAFAGSRISTSAGARQTACRSIDSALMHASPTLIKMDIEGAEPEALLGAVETMRRHRPVMAVCAYHKCDHLWQLPAILKSANPDYHIFLRRCAEECWETVYYAVPPERLALCEPSAY